MPMSQKVRRSIYRSFTTGTPMGQEEAEVLLSQFPSNELDVPATKEFVARGLAEVRGDLRTGLAEVRGEVAELRGEVIGLGHRMEGLGLAMEGLRDRMGGLSDRMDGLSSHVDGKFHEFGEQLAKSLRAQVIWLFATIVGALSVAVAVLR